MREDEIDCILGKSVKELTKIYLYRYSTDLFSQFFRFML